MRTFGGNPNPFDHVKGANGERLFTEKLEEHHGVPREIFSSGGANQYADSRQFLNEIGWDGEDFDRNGIFVAANERDALVSGSGMHRGPHPRMTEFINLQIQTIRSKYLQDVDAKAAELEGPPRHMTPLAAQAEARRLTSAAAKADMDRLVGTIPELLQRVDADGRPLAVLNNSDPRAPNQANEIMEALKRDYKFYEQDADGRWVPGRNYSALESYNDSSKRGLMSFNPDGTANWTPDQRAEALQRNDLVARVRNAAGNIDFDAASRRTRSAEFKSLVAQTAAMLRDLGPAANRLTSVNQVERAYVRAFRAVQEKMVAFADYAETRARMVIADIDAAGSRVPDYLRAGLAKAREYFNNPDGTRDRVRIGAGIATGVLAIGNIWVELDRRDYDPAATAAYLRTAARDAIESLPLLGGIMLAGMTPLGPAVMFTLGAVATYAAIKNIVHYMATDAGLDQNGITYKIAKSIDDALTAFEDRVKNYIELATKALAETVETNLEAFTGRSIEWLSEEAAGWVGEKNDILVGDDISLLAGDEENNWLIHRSAGEVFGEKGDDALIGWLPEEIKAGQAIGGVWIQNQDGSRQYLTAREIRSNEAAAMEAWRRAKESGIPDADNPMPEPMPDVVRAQEDYVLSLDGGEGNDWVVTILGEKAITAGGLGRDWIFNTSKEGELYGDYKGGLSPEGKPAPDTGANADNFWFWADTTIMDAQHFDVLKYFGLPLTGGDANGGIAGFAIMNGLFGAAVGMGNLARYATGQAQDWHDEVYIDHLQPWMIYTFQRDEDGNLDMYITNAFEQIFRGLMAALDMGAGEANESIHKGWMKVENVDVVGSRLGVLQGAAAEQILSNGKKGGSLGMVFRAVNPLQALLPVINFVPGAIGQALYYSVMADALVSTVEAGLRWAKMMEWAKGEDPLVIDLDGDGIETIAREHSKAYFDVDGDLFRESTGWLKGDDGFLVLDSNGNGRVDGIAELFGDRAQGGFAELAAYDSNNDGKVTAADLVWGRLQVWQDKDRDGETDAGELKSLDALGIVSLSLASTPLNVTTPQNARLLSSSAVTFANGRTTKMFEAIFTANEVDTKYAGEAGRAPWQSNASLNAKGFGTITDLMVAAANDPQFAELAQARAAAMTAPKIKDLVAKAGDVLGEWGMTLETSRELVAVRLGADGAMLDRAVYVEDQAGGYWTLRSGTAVLDSAGAAVARPTLEQVLAQGNGWRREQAWSPASRGTAVSAFLAGGLDPFPRFRARCSNGRRPSSSRRAGPAPASGVLPGFSIRRLERTRGPEPAPTSAGASVMLRKRGSRISTVNSKGGPNRCSAAPGGSLPPARLRRRSIDWRSASEWRLLLRISIPSGRRRTSRP